MKKVLEEKITDNRQRKKLTLTNYNLIPYLEVGSKDFGKALHFVKKADRLSTKYRLNV